MKEAIKNFIYETISQLVVLDSQVVLFAMLVAIVVILFDSFHVVASKKLKEAGIQAKSKAKAIDGSKTLPINNYVSEIQGIAGRPDAVIIENGFSIPVERKPLARKLRDRYVAQLLVYMRLIEEFEGKKPPYGYLILGSKCRRIKVYNTPEKQAWLDTIIKEMQNILKGAECKATPEIRKCSRCDVRSHCKFDASAHQIVTINSKSVAG